MSFQYTRVDGERVEVNVAAAFGGMAGEFRRVFGLTLHVSSGTRTEDEQWHLRNGWLRRLPGFNLAVEPKDSDHCEVGPSGPRALDLYDSGRDSGVTTVGTKRNNWVRDNCHRWGFVLDGLNFRPQEGWHIRWTGKLATGGGNGSVPTTSVGEAGVHGPNPFGIPFTGGLQKLAKLYGYKGALDQNFGVGSMAGIASFLRTNWGYFGNDVLGPQMWKAFQRWLKARWGYTGEIDGVPGTLTREALKRADTGNWNEL